MELVISFVQDEVMAFGVGGVHEVDPQEEATVLNLGGVHEVDATFNVINTLTPTTILVNHDYDQLEFSFLCHEVESKRVKEIVDQMLEGDRCRNPSLGLATKARACKGVGQMKPGSHISCS